MSSCWACGRDDDETMKVQDLDLCGACRRLYYRLRGAPRNMTRMGIRVARTERVMALVRSYLGSRPPKEE
jgi:hypothetical protein